MSNHPCANGIGTEGKPHTAVICFSERDMLILHLIIKISVLAEGRKIL